MRIGIRSCFVPEARVRIGFDGFGGFAGDAEDAPQNAARPVPLCRMEAISRWPFRQASRIGSYRLMTDPRKSGYRAFRRRSISPMSNQARNRVLASSCASGA